jgi:hypothetical protein
VEIYNTTKPSCTLAPVCAPNALVALPAAASALRTNVSVQWTDVQGISARVAWDLVDVTVAAKRERNAAGMGHVAFGTTTVPGSPAWSPPL